MLNFSHVPHENGEKKNSNFRRNDSEGYLKGPESRGVSRKRTNRDRSVSNPKMRKIELGKLPTVIFH